MFDDTSRHAPSDAPTFGLLLNAGAQLGATHRDVYDLLLAEARLADELGYHDLWVTEHHFIPFGINSSALVLASFLLGRTRRVRVGTAVTLTPHLHPMQVAEQAAILDLASGGRFDLGIGRGGYLQEYEVFGTDLARWDDEVHATASVLLDAWTHERVQGEHPRFRFAPASLVPRPQTTPHPPLFLGTATPESIALAARSGLGLLHYFATPAEARRAVEDNYAHAAAGVGPATAAHVHALVVVVADDEQATRAALAANLAASFRDGDWPHVPQAAGRHTGPDGKPLARDAMAAAVAAQAVVGPPESVVEQLRRFRAATGARRLVLFMEPIVERAALLRSIERFAREVAPALASA